MKKVLLFILFSLLVFVSGCDCSGNIETKTNELSGVINITGSESMVKLVRRWAYEFSLKYPAVSFNIKECPDNEAVNHLLSKKYDIGMFSREFNDVEKAADLYEFYVARGAVFPVINAANPFINEIKTFGLTKTHFKKIFTSKKTLKWNDFVKTSKSGNINVYTRNDLCGNSQKWAEFFNTDDSLLSGKKVNGVEAVINSIRNDIYGISYLDIQSIYDVKNYRKISGIEIIPLDLNEDRIIQPEEDLYSTVDNVITGVKSGLYPNPPTFYYYLSTIGRPKKFIVREFISFIFWHGQEYVDETGYVRISTEDVAKGKKRL